MYRESSGSQILVVSAFMTGLVSLTTSQMLRFWWLKVIYIVMIFEMLLGYNKLFTNLLMILVRAFELLWVFYFYLEEMGNKNSFIQKYIANSKLQDWKNLFEQVLPT